MGDAAQSSFADQELLQLAAAGDVRAFETLYRRHRDFVYRVARRFTPDHATAMDISQEAFVRVLRQVGTLRLNGRLSTYMYPIVKNLAAAQHRARTRHAEIERSIFAGGFAETGAPGDAELARALEKLSDDHREVVMLRIVDELSVDEVALALGIAPGTVKSRLHHALQHLKAAWPGERGG